MIGEFYRNCSCFLLPKLNYGNGGVELVTEEACCDHRQTNYTRP